MGFEGKDFGLLMVLQITFPEATGQSESHHPPWISMPKATLCLFHYSASAGFETEIVPPLSPSKLVSPAVTQNDRDHWLSISYSYDLGAHLEYMVVLQEQAC